MLRMKVLLLLAVTTTTVLLAGCGGVGGAETSTSNAAGTTPSVDTTPPSTPTGLAAVAAGSSGANLSWSASTHNVGVTAYILLRHGVQVATPAPTRSTLAPPWLYARHAGHHEFCRLGPVRCTDLHLRAAGPRRGRQQRPQHDERDRRDRELG